MPFAGYENFEDCVRKNAKRRDPKAYCAVIMRQAEGQTRISVPKKKPDARPDR